MLCISDFDMFGSPSLQPWMLWAFQLSPGTASFRSSKRYPSAIQALHGIASGKARFCMPNVLSTNLNNEEVDKTWQNVKYTGCISGWQVRCLPFGASVRCRLRKARQPAQVTLYDFVPHSGFDGSALFDIPRNGIIRTCLQKYRDSAILFKKSRIVSLDLWQIGWHSDMTTWLCALTIFNCNFILRLTWHENRNQVLAGRAILYEHFMDQQNEKYQGLNGLGILERNGQQEQNLRRRKWSSAVLDRSTDID